MKQSMKNGLKQYFEAPKPLKKHLFLRNMGARRIRISHILRIQIRYIPKWVWILSAIFFLLAWYFGRYLPEYALGSMMALVPFLVMISVAESMRSVTYGMQELELAAQFTLPNIVCARMVILGLANFILLIVVTLLIGEHLLKNAVYLMVPWLFTAFGCLVIMRKITGRENIAACAGFAAAVSSLDVMFHTGSLLFLDEKYFLLWFFVFLLLIGAVAGESRKTIRIMGELV